MDKKRNLSITKEGVAKTIFALAALFAIVSVISIIGYLLYAGLPAMREIGIFKFLFGKVWSPGYEGAASEKFGILPMIVGSTIAIGGALLIGGSLGITIAIFLVYFCPKGLKMPLTQLISLLAGIPSVVYGYFGLKQIVPLLAKISPNGNGTGILAVSLVLGIMILPTVTSLAKDGLSSVPSKYFEGSLALGMTKEQTVFKVMVPGASSGIMTALGLGIGRAVGETMAVIMVAGNSVQFPKGLFEGFMTLTGNIVMDMSYASGIHRSALVATGFVLLIFILILNGILYYVKSAGKTWEKDERRKLRQLKKAERRAQKTPCKVVMFFDRLNDKFIASNEKVKSKLKACRDRVAAKFGKVFNKDGGNRTYIAKNGLYKTLKYICCGSVIIMLAVVAYLLIFIFVKGIVAFRKIGVINFLFGKAGSGKISLAPAFVSTGALILIALAIALPIGICAAIYLVEYAGKSNKFVKIIRLFTDTLSGIPSIVFGLFGVIVFNDALGLGYSLMSGGLTLSIMILPTVIRSVEESLMAVPLAYREASYALGAGKVHTVFRIVLPSAMKGILTATILSIGRIVSESAALLLTAGSVRNMPKDIMSPGSSFAVMMYMFVSEGLYMNEAYATAVVLIILVTVINMLVFAFTPKKEKIK